MLPLELKNVLLQCDFVSLELKNVLFQCDFVSYDSLENELESLRNALLEARLESTPPKAKSKSPSINLYFFLPTHNGISHSSFILTRICLVSI